MQAAGVVSPGSPRRSSCGRVILGATLGVVVLAAMVLMLASPALAPPIDFPDVPGAYAYREAIADLVSRRVIAGYEDGRFGPFDAVNRQQFAKMIVLTAGYPVSERDLCPFSDVDTAPPGSLFPSHYVAVAAAKKIALGTSSRLFSPGSNISRFQVISMVVRAMDELHPGFLSAPPRSWTQTTGWDGDPTHGPNARRAEFHGLLSGLPLATLDPWSPMTRGEVAQVLHNMLLLGTAATSAGTNVTDITLPFPGSPAEAVYQALGWDSVYMVYWLGIEDGWAYVHAIPFTTTHGPTLDTRALLKKTALGGWQLMEVFQWEGLLSDVGNVAVDQAIPDQIRSAYPGLPPGIFPKVDPTDILIMDAVRTALGQPRRVFNVFQLTTTGGWAYTELRALRYIGGHIVESVDQRVLLQNVGGTWTVLKMASYGQMTQAEFVAALKAQYPSVPPEVLPDLEPPTSNTTVPSGSQ